MAGRKSKRKGTGKKAAAPDTNFCLVGIYIRLSSAACSNEDSAEVQEAVVRRWLEEHNQTCPMEPFLPCYVYRDLGVSGTGYCRAGFEQMMKDIQEGRLQCVAVKDLSRLGRNCTETGDYLERIFPELGIRFISVSENLDLRPEELFVQRQEVMIRNLVNEMYARQASFQMKLLLKKRREAGHYVGGPAPYGYQVLRREGRRMLIPDPEASQAVRMIYDFWISEDGYSYQSLSKKLQLFGIQPPRAYQGTGCARAFSKEEEIGRQEKTKAWCSSTLRRILTSRVYRGDLTQGLTDIMLRNEKTRRAKPPEEWVIRRNAHPAIITEETFQRAYQKVVQGSVQRSIPRSVQGLAGRRLD